MTADEILREFLRIMHANHSYEEIKHLYKIIFQHYLWSEETDEA